LSFDSQTTLIRPVLIEGVGIHTGQVTRLTLRPANVGAGVRFLRTDIKDRDPAIPATAAAVCATRLGTVIGNADGVTVATIEHLMAALSALAVDNILVEIDGPEVPIMDGSCRAFVEALDDAGRRPQGAPRRHIEILSTVRVGDDKHWAELSPASGFEVAFDIDFAAAAIGRQSLEIALDEASFRTELAHCRTFGFLHEVEALRASGLARGGSLDNVLVIDDGAVLNPGGLRCADEFVRHKALDAVGDLYLLGGPVIGRYRGVRAGHALNNALLLALAEQHASWRHTIVQPELARAG
jgi:UDP-3-O-[3-hydroxymyristoyl] N-acetylglucosamine deacetylase